MEQQISSTPKFARHPAMAAATYIGTVRLQEHGRTRESDYDLYFIFVDHQPNVVARYGNRPDQEYFGMAGSYGEMKCLTLARKLVKHIIGYNIDEALQVLVHSRYPGQVITPLMVECLEELAQEIDNSPEVRVFNIFEQRGEKAKYSNYVKNFFGFKSIRALPHRLTRMLRLATLSKQIKAQADTDVIDIVNRVEAVATDFYQRKV